MLVSRVTAIAPKGFPLRWRTLPNQLDSRSELVEVTHFEDCYPEDDGARLVTYAKYPGIVDHVIPRVTTLLCDGWDSGRSYRVISGPRPDGNTLEMLGADLDLVEFDVRKPKYQWSFDERLTMACDELSSVETHDGAQGPSVGQVSL